MMTRHFQVIGRAVLALALGAGCASGGATSPADAKPDGPASHFDAPHSPFDAPLHDAPMAIDAKVFHDASPMIDAPAAGFCTDNTQCGPADCCFVAVCVPGTRLGPMLCFPT